MSIATLSNKREQLLIVLIFTLGTALFLGYQFVISPAKTNDNQAAFIGVIETADTEVRFNSEARLEQPASSFKDEEDAFLTYLLQQLNISDKEIHDPLWQMQTLDEWVALFEAQYGVQWEIELLTFIERDFPSIEATLKEKLKNKIHYESWLEDNLSQDYVTLKDQQDAMWQKRVEIFGEEANQIWRYEMAEKVLQENLQTVEISGDFFQQSAVYLNELAQVEKNIIGDESAKNSSNQIARAEQFLSLSNVQENLHDMTDEQRAGALKQFRQELGMSDEATERMAKLDVQRAQERKTGSLYEETRLEGALSEEHLMQLRIQLFGNANAHMIRNEEQAGYYRYQQPYVIGLN